MKYIIAKGFKMAACLIFGAVVFGSLVMVLWNWLLPDLLSLPHISFIQAIGLLMLSRILFGGFHKGGGCGSKHNGTWRRKMKDKYKDMSPEERQKFKKKLEKYCNHNYCDDSMDMSDMDESIEKDQTTE